MNLTAPNPSLASSFALLGQNFRELLASSVDLGDVNGDEYPDLLLRGDARSYVVLGPIDLNSIEAIADRPFIELDSQALGQPLSHGGDVNADGTNDLAFVRQDFVGGVFVGAVATVVFGGSGLRPRGASVHPPSGIASKAKY